jgi:phosphoribosylaminoimidazolecarboxamide formyltransferase/IMP cyclohydrolase
MAGNVVREVEDWIRPAHVLVSVSDKRELPVLINGLASINDSIRFLSTGGTHARIAEILGPDAAERQLLPVAQYTGQPETQGGLVKTLDFKIYLGLLTETFNPDHQQDLARTGSVPIDMVVCNLYPFAETVARPDVTVEQARANIDIGGPCMVRAAAKNYLRVASVTEPDDYGMLVSKMRAAGGRIDLATRFALAQKAFAHTAAYDRAIAGWLGERSAEEMQACYDKKGA